MCGIVGILNLNGTVEVNRSLLNDMNQIQIHRGPDEGNLHIENHVGLGHRRLSIIDLASGQQPLANEDNSIFVTYNGEIYNYLALKKELLQLGHHFKTNSDTEVIVHAWEQWGESCVKHFRGMFAFAIWDRNQQVLFLARDRLGIKPLHYAILNDRYFIFASELKALYLHPDLKKEIDPFAVQDYFTLGYIPDPKTIYKEIRKLAPGNMLLVSLSKPTKFVQKSYWDVSFEEKITATEPEVAEELVARIKEAIEIRLVAEVPLGAFLSGGVDSSTVVALMAELMNEPVNTCAIGFDQKNYDETTYASMVAKHCQTKHYQQQVNSNDFSLLDKLADIYDEPFADSSALPTYQVCGLAKKRVTVALSGDGGDEILAGYRRQRFHVHEEKIRSIFPYFIRKPVFGCLGKVYPKLDSAPQFLRAKTTLQALARDSVEAYMHSVSINSFEDRNQLFSAQLKQQLQGYQSVEVFREHASKLASEHPLSIIQYLDIKTYLPCDILTKVDRVSMHHSLEVRVPLLDHKLIEWISMLPPDIKLKGSEGKYILKKALEPYLPHEVLYRKKMGFSVPLADWFRGALKNTVADVILGSRMADCGYFDHDFLKRIVNQHQSGRRDFTTLIWSLFMFNGFLLKCKA
jgi:asparagine synthase (glutamine-hydrolysing)